MLYTLSAVFYLEAGPRQAETSAGGLEPTGLLHSLAVILSFYGDKWERLSHLGMADRRPEEAAVGVLVILLVGISSRWGEGLATSRPIRDTGVLVIDNSTRLTSNIERR